jgi:hypothetical protein
MTRIKNSLKGLKVIGEVLKCPAKLKEIAWPKNGAAMIGQALCSKGRELVKKKYVENRLTDMGRFVTEINANPILRQRALVAVASDRFPMTRASGGNWPKETRKRIKNTGMIISRNPYTNMNTYACYDYARRVGERLIRNWDANEQRIKDIAEKVRKDNRKPGEPYNRFQEKYKGKSYSRFHFIAPEHGELLMEEYAITAPEDMIHQNNTNKIWQTEMCYFNLAITKINEIRKVICEEDYTPETVEVYEPIANLDDFVEEVKRTKEKRLGVLKGKIASTESLMRKRGSQKASVFWATKEVKQLIEDAMALLIEMYSIVARINSAALNEDRPDVKRFHKILDMFRAIYKAQQENNAAELKRYKSWTVENLEQIIQSLVTYLDNLRGYELQRLQARYDRV